MVSRSMLAPKEVEDVPKIEEINGDGHQPLVIRRDPLVSANIGEREQIDQWMDLFRDNCLIHGRRVKFVINTGSSTNLLVQCLV